MATASIRVTGNTLEDLFEDARARCGELYGDTREVTSLSYVALNKVPDGALWFAKARPVRTAQPVLTEDQAALADVADAHCADHTQDDVAEFFTGPDA